MNTYSRIAVIFAAGLACVAVANADGPSGQPGPGGALLDAAGVKGGVLIHLGCGKGELTADFARGRGLLVQGLDLDAAEVEQARALLQSQKLYGQASIVQLAPPRLPYADNLINCIVLERPGKLLSAGLTAEECFRVLSPNGPLLVKLDAADAGLEAKFTAAGFAKPEKIQNPAGWLKLTKPRPAGMDEWTHREHDAGSTGVSADTALGPPAELQWVAGPGWPMGIHKAGNGVVLSGGGRTFVVTFQEEGNIDRPIAERAGKFFLVARNAYNGLLLWRRPCTREKGPAGPVLGGERVFLVQAGAVSALDAATGKTVNTYEQAGTSVAEILFHDGLLLAMRSNDWVAIDPESGAVKWKLAGGGTPRIDGGFAYFAGRDKKLAKVDVKTGKELWRKDAPAGLGNDFLFAKSGLLLFHSVAKKGSKDNSIQAVSGDDGSLLWKYDFSCMDPPTNIFFAANLVWVRNYPPDTAKSRSMAFTWEGLNPKTGAVEKKFPDFRTNQSCGNRAVATEKFYLWERPPNFFDWQDGQLHKFAGLRGACTGILTPANGLLYTQPVDCGCIGQIMRGTLAVASASADKIAPVPDDARLTKGPAFGTGPADMADKGWGTFRAGPSRSAATPAAVPGEFKLRWKVQLASQSAAENVGAEWRAGTLGGDSLTQPTLAGDRIFISLSEAHQVLALEAATGKQVWSFTAGGRLDTPPTLYKGLCLIGCRDGYVYAVNAADGKLAWRFLAAPADRKLVAYGQLESKWPVWGGVLVQNDKAFVIVGRHPEVDGGVQACALEPLTGKLIWRVPVTGQKNKESKSTLFLPDIMVGDGKALRAGPNGFFADSATGKPVEAKQDFAGLTGGGQILDRSWHWIEWSFHHSGYQHQTAGGVSGQIIAFDGSGVYGYHKVQISSQERNDKDAVSRLFAKPGGSKTSAWTLTVAEPGQVEALASTKDLLFAAGPKDRRDRAKGGTLMALAKADGKKVKQIDLPSPPAAEGLAAAEGMLLVALEDGSLACFGE